MRDTAKERIQAFIASLQNEGLTSSEINSLVADAIGKELRIPVSVLQNRKLGSLEAIVKYLRENKSLSLKDIASKLNRSAASLSVTYKQATKKHPEPLEVPDSSHSVPLSVFVDRKLSVLEHIVSYLKSLNLTYHQIAVLLNRDDRTIWTVYSRARKKNGE